ncbi:MAG: hypothetical protein LAT62_10110 [Natronospirillum sp.]|uniref:hypothetical protein n=1 Tax=Natronospirillum sp. TaxID=2812955 RepID=UPI0025F7B151|nr:hypothetical protein [Natronospirillum sp.]MCH8552280.1 hypothetical protein [Natronospirillum sp.]
MPTLSRRLRQKRFWIIALGSVLLVLGVQVWRPFPVTWDSGMILHHVTVFCALYLASRWRLAAHLAFSLALGVTVVPLVFTGAPLGQYSLALVGEFGLLNSGSLMLVALLDYRWRNRPQALFPVWFWCVAGLFSAVAVGGQWISMDLFPYFHGENTPWLARFAVICIVLLCLTGHYWAVAALVMMALGYEWRLLDSHNAFDYTGDLFWLLALPLVLVHRWRQSRDASSEQS